MKVLKNDFLVADREASGFPATYWYGDLYECPVCSTQIATGFGAQMYKSHQVEAADALVFDYEPNAAAAEKAGAA